MNEAVLQSIEEHALTPEAIEKVIQLTERDDVQEQQFALARERKDVEKRIKRLVAAVETAGDVASLAVKLRELEARRNVIDSGLRAAEPPKVLNVLPIVLALHITPRESRYGGKRCVRVLRNAVSRSRRVQMVHCLASTCKLSSEV